MSESTCYYYDGQRNRCNCYVNENLNELLAENAKLRERIHELEMEGSDHFYRTAYAEDANSTLESENIKLRELAAHAWLLFMKHGAVHTSDLPEVDAVRDELRELEVEVDEWAT